MNINSLSLSLPPSLPNAHTHIHTLVFSPKQTQQCLCPLAHSPPPPTILLTTPSPNRPGWCEVCSPRWRCGPQRASCTARRTCSASWRCGRPAAGWSPRTSWRCRCLSPCRAGCQTWPAPTPSPSCPGPASNARTTVSRIPWPKTSFMETSACTTVSRILWPKTSFMETIACTTVSNILWPKTSFMYKALSHATRCSKFCDRRPVLWRKKEKKHPVL